LCHADHWVNNLATSWRTSLGPIIPVRAPGRRLHCASVITASTGTSYLLPTHKTDQHHTGVRVLLPAPPILPFNGLPPFRRYLQTRDTLFPYHPALWITLTGTVPTRSWFLRRLRRFFPSSSVSGHSMHAGGATALACAGFAPALIQSAKRWSSTTFEGYIRQHPFILHALMQPGGLRPQPPPPIKLGKIGPLAILPSVLLIPTLFRRFSLSLSTFSLSIARLCLCVSIYVLPAHPLRIHVHFSGPPSIELRDPECPNLRVPECKLIQAKRNFQVVGI